MTQVPLPPNDLSALAALVNGTLWADWADEGRTFAVPSFRGAVHYLRLKPSDSCRIVVFAGSHPAEPLEGFLLYLYADLERARVSFKKASARHSRPSNHVPFLCEANKVVGVPFPNDRELPGLSRFYETRRSRRLVRDALPAYPQADWRHPPEPSRRELLAYKPGRRAVYRLDLDLRRRGTHRHTPLSVHVKLENESTALANHRNLVMIRDRVPASAAWRVPEPFGCADGLLTREWIEGPTLLRCLEAAQDSTTRLARIGRAIAELHELEFELDPATTDADGPGATARDLAQLVPDERDRILEIGDRLEEELKTGTREHVLLHGDLHPGQVIDDGTRPVLLDFDRVTTGPRARDLGDFLARLTELGAGPEAGQAFLDGYSSAHGRPIDESAVRIHRAAAHFRRACFSFRTLDPRWRSRVDRSLTDVESLLGAIHR